MSTTTTTNAANEDTPSSSSSSSSSSATPTPAGNTFNSLNDSRAAGSVLLDPDVEKAKGAAADVEVPVGAGGCTAYAGAKLTGLTKSEFVTMLDNEMDTAYACINSSRKHPCPKQWIGVKGKSWHPEVVRLALQNNFASYTFKVTKIKRGMFKKDKKYLVIGYLNRSCIGPLHPNGGNVYGEVGDDVTPYNRVEYRHSILVEGGKFHCQGIAALGASFENGTWPIEYLWLNKKGQPNRKKGYMEEITKVYEVSVGERCHTDSSVTVKRKHGSSSSSAASLEESPTKKQRIQNLSKLMLAAASNQPV
jgi:hypothetical protein